MMQNLLRNGLPVVIAGLFVSLLQAGPKVYVGLPISASRPVPMERIDHSTWNDLLRRYVDEDGGVDYQQWHANAVDVKRLDEYLAALSAADPAAKATSDARLAFWINAYNAVTIKGILREYPTSSIRNHTAKLFGYNIWKDLMLHVGSQQHSLDEMEHNILRKLGDPRIHFAIVCASKGCPRLLNEAYLPDQVQQQLEANAIDFFSRPENFLHHPSDGQFELSAILKWFGEDFGADQSAGLKKISRWLPDDGAQQAAATGRGRIDYLAYDWTLNERSEASAGQ